MNAISRLTTGVTAGVLAAGIVLAAPLPVSAQWVTTHDQFYLEAPHNWRFRDRYQAADRLFNAFDFGHAILYETLWSKPGAPPSELETKWYNRLTTDILIHPPRVPLEESAIEIGYVKLVPEAKAMFEWAHILHRQLYDVLADDRLDQAAKDREVARLIAYYKTRPDLAFSSRPKSMALMQEQAYSLAFRKGYPKFNGLIWAYHWLQIGLYEPLLVNATPETRQAGVRATVARFWQMLDMAPMHMPHVMPMTPAIAPRFAERYAEAAVIFDNLHSMHDVVSDILANPSVPRGRKRAEILLAARRFRDDTSFVMSVPAWRAMAGHMGIENMGGPAVGFLSELPTPTVTYGAVMTHDDRTGAMTGFTYGSATGGAHAQHGGEVARPDSAKVAADPHAAHAAADTAAKAAADPDAAHAAPSRADTAMRHDMRMMSDSAMMRMHMRMMADPVIRERMMADSAMHRMMMDMMRHMPAAERERMERMMRAPSARTANPKANVKTKPTARLKANSTATKAVTKTSTKAKASPRAPTKTSTKAKTITKAPAKAQTKTKAADPHAGHKPPE